MFESSVHNKIVKIIKGGKKIMPRYDVRIVTHGFPPWVTTVNEVVYAALTAMCIEYDRTGQPQIFNGIPVCGVQLLRGPY